MKSYKMTIQSYEPISATTVSRSFGYINRDYLGTIGVALTDPAPPAVIDGNYLPSGYQSFWHWADVIARALNSLTSMTYRDTTITAEWSTTEELNS